MKRSLLALLGLAQLFAAWPAVGAGSGARGPRRRRQDQADDTVKREEVVVVTASKVETTLINAPATMSVITTRDDRDLAGAELRRPAALRARA